MKKSILSFLILLIQSSMLLAQNPMDQVKSATGTVPSPNFGTVLSNLTSNINTSAFTSSFAKTKDDFIKKLGSLNSTDLKSASSMVEQLAKGLNPSSFLKGWKPSSDWLNKLKSSSTIQQLSSQTETLVKNMDPKIFKSGFDVSSVTSALSMLGGMK